MRRFLTVAGYALLLAFLFFSLVFYRSYFVFLLLLLFVCLPVFSLLTARTIFRRLTVSIRPSSPQAEKNTPVSFLIRIDKPSFLPLAGCTLSFCLENRFYPAALDNTVTFPLSPRKDHTLSIPFSSARSGCIRILVSEMEGRDYLGFLRLKRTLSLENELLILPEEIPLSLPENVLGGTGFEDYEETAAVGQVSSEVRDFRDYRPGDRMQAIHWKLSAKNTLGIGKNPEETFQPIVKEFEHPSAKEPELLLELCAGFGAYPDALFDLTYSVGTLLLKEQQPFRLCWYSAANAALKEETVTNVLDFLTAITKVFHDTIYEEPDAAWLQAKTARSRKGSLYYLCPKDRKLLDGGEVLYCHKDSAVLLTCDSI